MSLEEDHKLRHEVLHDALGELWDDFKSHFPQVILQNTTVGQLLAWSKEQTVKPTEPETREFYCGHCGEHVELPGTHTCESGGLAA